MKNEFIWAALDCSGAFAVLLLKLRLIVLGKIAVTIENEINNEELINKLRKIAEFDSNFTIKTMDSKISIEI